MVQICSWVFCFIFGLGVHQTAALITSRSQPISLRMEDDQWLGLGGNAMAASTMYMDDMRIPPNAFLPGGRGGRDMRKISETLTQNYTKALEESAEPTACDATPDPGTRTLLRTLVPPYHGSTALEVMLMSSGKVGTLCKSKTWQCEGSKLFRSSSVNRSVNMAEKLETFSQFWDSSKPVLLEKSTDRLMGVLQDDMDLWDTPVPKKLKREGVTFLQPRYILMYRPLCLWALSTKAAAFVEKEARRHAQKELRHLEHLAEIHKHFKKLGRAPLVISYADLLWNPDFTQLRVEHYLPCLGSLDMDFLPKLGRDIFPKNEFKVSVGIRSFGEHIDPKECCNYQVGSPASSTKGRCMKPDGDDGNSDVGTLKSYLTPFELTRYEAAFAYLRKFS
mmetsp:Transcript_66720/g.145505  ORF Transcript_66720/g.145505 Transcript_66720/m.145505 type:complete len:391 (+) Transcript_66720:58-1230(+)